jgi:AraC family transcriptional regulator
LQQAAVNQNERAEMYSVEIVKRPQRRVVGISQRGPYNQIGGAFGRLAAELGERGLWAEAIEFLGVYFDDPREVPAADLRSIAGIAVRRGLALPEGFDEAKVQGGQHAVLHHFGPYDSLPAAWAWLYEQWLPHSGLAGRSGAACEIYLNAPGEMEAAALATDICVPVARGPGART